MRELETTGGRPLRNTRWESFCIAYTGVFRRNAAAAYMSAGYKPKTPEIAASAAERLLRNVDIQARIGHLNDEALKIERLHARDAVARLAAIATARLSDYLDGHGRIDPAKVADPALSGAVQEMTQEDTEYGLKIRIKLKDDMRALELLGLTDKAGSEAATQNNVFIIETS